ncbi:CotD family spore coat protein [Bacillus piscicola]|uniref:CotD family spore coat protein n=1 Tax=Bacillus piscicola TaxID=1632684 RepID=UPI001F09AD4B|nr:CotD family spore coat protein [Bacillus piscicola]
MFKKNRPCVMPPVCHPVVNQTAYNCNEYIVPEVHPVHTTTVNKHMYKHYHTYPQTYSDANEVYHQHFVDSPGAGPLSGPMPGPMSSPVNGPVNSPVNRPRPPHCCR